MNFRTINDKGETTIHDYKVPSSVATTASRVREGYSRKERRAKRRLETAIGGMIAHQNNRMISHTPTAPGALKH
jgi:hypothetical protein